MFENKIYMVAIRIYLQQQWDHKQEVQQSNYQQNLSYASYQKQSFGGTLEHVQSGKTCYQEKQVLVIKSYIL